FHFGEARQWWWVTLTQVGEDEAQVLLGRIAADADLSRKGGVLGRLLHAFACVVVLPTVIEAANAVALDPACRELGAAMRAAERQQVRLAAFTSIEREVLAHDTDGQCPARLQLAGHQDRMPEHAHVPSPQRPGPGMNDVLQRHLVFAAALVGLHQLLLRSLRRAD